MYESHWYRLFEIELQWIQAENFCRNFGGTLVSINDQAENDFVHKLRKSAFFFFSLSLSLIKMSMKNFHLICKKKKKKNRLIYELKLFNM